MALVKRPPLSTHRLILAVAIFCAITSMNIADSINWRRANSTDKSNDISAKLQFASDVDQKPADLIAKHANGKSTETINHIRHNQHHRHQQIIGNIRVLTEIDIANVISVLNTLANGDEPTPQHQQAKDKQVQHYRADGTAETIQQFSQISNRPSAIGASTPSDQQLKFKRLERPKSDNYKPFIFPNSILSEIQQSRFIRWPSDQHSNNAFDIDAKMSVKPIFDKLMAAFPISLASSTSITVSPMITTIAVKKVEENKQNGQKLVRDVILSSKLPPQASPAYDSSKEINSKDGLANTTVALSSSLSSNVTVNVINNGGRNSDKNQTYDNINSVIDPAAIASGLEPFIYIDAEGIFQIKYVWKGQNASTIKNDEITGTTSKHHMNDSSLASPTINNKTEESAIIFNDDQQIRLGSLTTLASYNNNNGTKIPTDNNNTDSSSASNSINIEKINNNINQNNSLASVAIYVDREIRETNTTQPLLQPYQQQQQTSTTPLSNNDAPRLFNGRPVFT